MTRDSSVGRAEDCSWYDADILRSPVRLRFAGCGFFFQWSMLCILCVWCLCSRSHVHIQVRITILWRSVYRPENLTCVPWNFLTIANSIAAKYCEATRHNSFEIPCKAEIVLMIHDIHEKTTCTDHKISVDEDGIRTHAGRPQWISSPSP